MHTYLPLPTYRHAYLHAYTACIYAYMSTHTHANSIHAYTACIHAYMSTHTHAKTYTQVHAYYKYYIYIYVCMYVCMYICIYVHTDSYVYVFAYAHVNSYATAYVHRHSRCCLNFDVRRCLPLSAFVSLFLCTVIPLSLSLSLSLSLLAYQTGEQSAHSSGSPIV